MWFHRFITKLAFPQMNSSVPEISLQDAHDTCNMLIGPLYHGTTEESAKSILETGFRWDDETDIRHRRNGYLDSEYIGTGCIPPIHHLGFGIYLTQVKNIGKQFSSGKLLENFYVLKEAKIEVINFGSNNTMMKWWKSQGYNCELAKTNRVKATQLLTDNLKSKFDAVLFKGQGIRRLLDGNQICIYNPAILRQVNKKLAKPGEIGSKVQRKSDGMKGILVKKYQLPQDKATQFHNGERELLTIKWNRGGTDYNIYPSEVIFL